VLTCFWLQLHIIAHINFSQGRGVIHAEMPVYGDNLPEPRGLQLWVDLPKQV
jgi:redox-sensitive bicupin YhaK (pirin superfamily)